MFWNDINIIVVGCKDMGDKSIKNRETKKKKKAVSTTVDSFVIKSIVSQPEVIKKAKKEKQ